MLNPYTSDCISSHINMVKWRDVRQCVSHLHSYVISSRTANTIKTFEKENFCRLFNKTMNVFTTATKVICFEAVDACGITCKQKWYVCGCHNSCLRCMLPGAQVTTRLGCNRCDSLLQRLSSLQIPSGQDSLKGSKGICT